MSHASHRVRATTYRLCCYDVAVSVEGVATTNHNALCSGVIECCSPSFQFRDADDVSLDQAIPTLSDWRDPGEG